MGLFTKKEKINKDIEQNHLVCKFCSSINTRMIRSVGFTSNELTFVDDGYTLRVCLDCGKVSTGIESK